MEQLDESLQKRITVLQNSVSTQRDPNNSIMIPRIPATIKSRHEDFYKPRLVAMGPYQNHDDAAFKDIESHKHRYLKDFLERNNKVDLGTYMRTVKALNEEHRLIKCYSQDESVKDDTAFVQMLLLDGCFILELALKLEEKKKHHLCAAGWDFMTILSDLLLIENQIPFSVLEKMYATYKADESSADLKRLLVESLFPNLGNTRIIQSIPHDEPWNPKVNHLLNLYHEFTLLETKAAKSNGGDHEGSKRMDSKVPVVIPSATQLLEYGFELQDIQHNSDATITRLGTINIPQIIVDSARKAILMNLLEFEQALDNKSKSRWTGLMVLITCMVKTKADLEVLRRRCIVVNLLPSEDKAMEFFGQLCEYITADYGKHYYSDLVEVINGKCKSYFRKTRANFMHDYFQNPWAVLSFVCSTLAIILSTVQTIVSVSTYRHRFL